MYHPFQCLACIEDKYLVAASGPEIIIRSLQSEGKFSKWSSKAPTSNGNDAANGDEGRPKKRQKIATTPQKAPNVIKLAVSPDQRHVIAVTDDKYLRVFEQNSGELSELSQRCMPKRPCAVQVLPDNATILVGDKFGDVYSLPLIQTATEDIEITNGIKEPAQPEAAFKPSATDLTVHSKRNLKALEAQKKQKDFTPRKDPLKFKHELLLGHVSMLTDMKYFLHPSFEKKGYIVTADRDEHIRISRGPPQAYVIEGFCLGHTQFINKVCQVGRSDLLVSGGGDDWLGVWHWLDFKLLRKVDLMPYVREVLTPLSTPEDFRLAISGIWSMDVDKSSNSTKEEVIVVACEKVKALFLLSRTSLEQDLSPPNNVDPRPIGTIKLDSNALDVVAIGNKIIMSVDDRAEQSVRCIAYEVDIRDGGGAYGSKVEPASSPSLYESLMAINHYGELRKDLAEKDLDDLLYNVASLRKRGHQAGQDGGEDDEVAPEDE